MKIHHHIEVATEDIDSIFDAIVTTCLSTYPSTEMQTSALTAMKAQSLTWLESILNTAFKLGEKVGKTHASEKDTIWYMEEKP